MSRNVMAQPHGIINRIGDKYILRLRYRKDTFDLFVTTVIVRYKFPINVLLTMNKKRQQYVVLEAVASYEELLQLLIATKRNIIRRKMNEINSIQNQLKNVYIP